MSYNPLFPAIFGVGVSDVAKAGTILGTSAGSFLGSVIGGFGVLPPWYTQGNFDGVAPSLWLDFKKDQYAVFGVEKPFSDLFTVARNSIGTYIDSAGVMQTAAINTARFTHDPITLQPLGLLIEPQRRNELLNTATLSTQSFTTAATIYTLSFYGTGTITLSGAYSGTLVGTGSFPNRVSLTFTSTAASLTLTVTGTCSLAQLELGTEPTSYIPNAGTRTTRFTDNITNSASNVVTMASWYNPTTGTFTAKYTPGPNANSQRNVLLISDGTANNRLLLNTFTTPNLIGGGVRVVSGGVSQYIAVDVGTETLNALNAEAFSFAANNMQVATNGTLANPYTAATVLPVAPSILHLGVSVTGNSETLNGTLSELRFYPAILSKPNMIRVTSTKEVMHGFGDSITVGFNATPDANKWVNLVAADLGLGAINDGISSTILQNTNLISTGIPQPNNGRDRYVSYLTGVNKGDWVFILYGVNDIRNSTTETSLTAALYQNDLQEIVLGLLSAGYLASKIIIGSPPYFVDGDVPVMHTACVAAARAVAVATGVKYADVYQAMVDNGGAALVVGDDLHPTNTGHQVIADALLLADFVS